MLKHLVGWVLILLGCFSLVGMGLAAEADVKQQRLQAELERSLVAPCCWNMTVDQHESGASREVRQEISRLLEQGKGKREILNIMVARYGERILSTPSQDNLLGRLAYWLIPVAIALGAVIVALAIRRYMKPGGAGRTPRGPKSSPAGDDWDSRVEEELKDLD